MPRAPLYTEAMTHRDSPEGMAKLAALAEERGVSVADTLRALIREGAARAAARQARRSLRASPATTEEETETMPAIQPVIVQTIRRAVKNSTPRTWGIAADGSIYLLSRHSAGWQPVEAVAGRFGMDRVQPPAIVLAAAEAVKAEGIAAPAGGGEEQDL